MFPIPVSRQADNQRPRRVLQRRLPQCPCRWRRLAAWCWIAIVTASCVAASGVITASAVAQTPSLQPQKKQLVPPRLVKEPEQKLAVPPLDTIPKESLPNSDSVERKVRRALDGDAPETDSDPMLDDLLQVIRRKGSVLDGSVLDPANEASLLKDPDAKQHDAPAYSNEDARALAAESLLRSARLLQRLGTSDPASRELVSQMRRQAAKLLFP